VGRLLDKTGPRLKALSILMFFSRLVKEIVEVLAKTPAMKVLRLEGNTIAPLAADELAKALKQTKALERFIGNDLFTGRLKDEIPLALVRIWIRFSTRHLIVKID
jgi:Ran GTPase-activating protein (RanGAP) involved in mRNA processing and transport